MIKKLKGSIYTLSILGIVLSGCDTKNVNTDVGYDVYTQKTVKPMKDKLYKIGETIEFDRILITID